MTQTAKKETEMLQEDNYAPDFKMNTDNDGIISLALYQGKKNVVLYFYPKDDTPGCTIEAKNFADAAKQFDRLDAVIVGVSRDSVQSHNAFKEKFCLPFQLASDETGTVCEAYDTWVEKNMYGKTYMGIQRDTFLIDKEGKIRRIWRKVKPEGHAQEVLEAIRSL